MSDDEINYFFQRSDVGYSSPLRQQLHGLFTFIDNNEFSTET